MDFCNRYPLDEREGRAMALLEMLGLQDVADKLPAALSGGQQQIAAIARALANDPPIIVADEPTGNLDSNTAEHVLDVFSQLAEQCKTILIVTHDPALAQRTARQVVIVDGELADERVAKASHATDQHQRCQDNGELIRALGRKRRVSAALG
jgi:putative ABC transport system ATP-binding protein